MLSRAENLRKQHRHLARSWLPQNVMNGCDQGHISCIACSGPTHTETHLKRAARIAYRTARKVDGIIYAKIFYSRYYYN